MFSGFKTSKVQEFLGFSCIFYSQNDDANEKMNNLIVSKLNLIFWIFVGTKLNT